MEDRGCECLQNIQVDMDSPTILYSKGQHQVYWLGTTEETVFRTNTYLIRDRDRAIVIDPGARGFLPEMKRRIEQILPLTALTDIIACHQDPDVTSAIADFLEIQPAIKVWTTSRAYILILHYMAFEWDFMDVVVETSLKLSDGNELRFITAPFLHSPAAFVTYDTASHYLFSGDVWASLETKQSLNFSSFAEHLANMDLFHVDYMASNLAAKGFVDKIRDLEIDGILPQHGSIIPKEFVSQSIHYLENLRCGTDVIYAHLIEN